MGITDLCCRRRPSPTEEIQPMHYQDDMSPMFDQLKGLTPQQIATIKHRYHFLMKEYRRRCFLYSILFYFLKTTMTAGSLAVPALLTIQTKDTSSNDVMYWVTWTISLAVTTANGLMTLFKLDKRFFQLHGVAERLRSETWQYLTLSGRYSGHYGKDTPTHANQYVYYCSHVEKIRMKHVEEEFIKQADMLSATSSSSATPATSTSSTAADAQQQQQQANVKSSLVPTPPTNPQHQYNFSDRDSISSLESNAPPPPPPPSLDRRESVSTVGEYDDSTVITVAAAAPEKKSHAKTTATRTASRVNLKPSGPLSLSEQGRNAVS